MDKQNQTLVNVHSCLKYRIGVQGRGVPCSTLVGILDFKSALAKLEIIRIVLHLFCLVQFLYSWQMAFSYLCNAPSGNKKNDDH